MPALPSNSSPSGEDSPEIERTLSELVQCLDDEFQAYLREDLEQIEAVMRRKQQLLRSLPSLGIIDGRGAQSPAPGSSPATVRLLHDINKRNQRNLIVLAPRLQQVRAKLQFLLGALGGTELYGRSGSGSRNTVALPRSLRQYHQSA